MAPRMLILLGISRLQTINPKTPTKNEQKKHTTHPRPHGSCPSKFSTLNPSTQGPLQCDLWLSLPHLQYVQRTQVIAGKLKFHGGCRASRNGSYMIAFALPGRKDGDTLHALARCATCSDCKCSEHEPYC